MREELTSYSPYIDELYEAWKQDPGGVDPSWQDFFLQYQNYSDYADGVPFSGSAVLNAEESNAEESKAQGYTPDQIPVQKRFPRYRVEAMDPQGLGSSLKDSDAESLVKQGRVNSLIWAYRDVGYIYATTNPLESYLSPDQYYRLFTIEGDYESLT